MTIDGEVVAVHSYWVSDGSRIVTEATVRTPGGEDVVVSQIGGNADGFTMIQTPGPELLAPGMRVAVAAHRDADLVQREHVVLDSVKVLAYPPGYVRTVSPKLGRPLRWPGSCVYVVTDDAGTTAIAGDGELAAIDAAINEWNNQTSSCSYLNLINDGRRALEASGKDHINLIKFRDTVWGRPAVDNDPPRTHSPSAAALTLTTMFDDPRRPDDPRNGEIVDADVELNGVNFAISIRGESHKTGCHAELQNTLTHELGHLLGLEHTCLLQGDPPRVDDQGRSVSACALTTDPKITEATMYPTQTCGETKKQTVDADDIAGICGVYPTSQDPDVCERGLPDQGGCCATSNRPGASLLLAAMTMVLTLRRRRA